MTKSSGKKGREPARDSLWNRPIRGIGPCSELLFDVPEVMWFFGTRSVRRILLSDRGQFDRLRRFKKKGDIYIIVYIMLCIVKE